MPVANLDVDRGMAETGAKQPEHGVDQLIQTNVAGPLGLLVEAEALGDDVGDAGEFLLRLREVGGGQAVGAGSRHKKEIAHGLEGIIDLVGDRTGEAADGGQLLDGFELPGDAGVFLELKAQLELRHDLAGKGFKRRNLARGERARPGVEDADGAQDVAVRGNEGGARVKADLRLAEHQSILRKAGIDERVFDDQGAGLYQGVSAEAVGARGFSCTDADSRLKPLPLAVDQGDHGRGCIADLRGEPRNVVVVLLEGCIENAVTLERCETSLFIGRDGFGGHRLFERYQPGSAVRSCN